MSAYKNAVIIVFYVPCSQRLQVKEQVATAFLDKFQLKPDEMKSLRGTKDGMLHVVSIECFLISFCLFDEKSTPIMSCLALGCVLPSQCLHFKGSQFCFRNYKLEECNILMI